MGLVFAITRPSIAGLLALASLGSSFGQSPETLQLNSVSLQTSIAVEIRLFSAAKDMVVPYCSEGEGGSLRLCNLAVRLERESRNEWRRVGLRTHTQARTGRRAYGEICRQDIDSRVNFHPRVPVPGFPHKRVCPGFPRKAMRVGRRTAQGGPGGALFGWPLIMHRDNSRRRHYRRPVIRARAGQRRGPVSSVPAALSAQAAPGT